MAASVGLIILFGINVAGMLMSVVLFITFRRELKAHHAQQEAQQRAASGVVHELKTRLEQIQGTLSELSRSGPVVPADRKILNPEAKARALRLTELGVNSREAAECLGVPRQEVDLFLRIRRMRTPADRS